MKFLEDFFSAWKLIQFQIIVCMRVYYKTNIYIYNLYIIKINLKILSLDFEVS